MKRLRHKRRRGFSLIELLVVTMIIVMLAGTVGITVFKLYGRAQDRRIKSDMKTIERACGYYRLNSGGSYASSVEGFLEEHPRDPWGNNYDISIDGDMVIVISLGADGVAGGDDDNRDRSNQDEEFMK